MKTKARLAIIGAGELGRLIAFHAREDAGMQITGFYDDFSKEPVFDNAPVLGTTGRILADYRNGAFDLLMIGIGYNHMKARNKYLSLFKGEIPFANILHSSSYVDKSCRLGEGIFLLPGVTVDTGVVLGDNVLINAGSTVAHHTEISRNTFIAPGVTIAGLVKIGEECFIGIGSTILDCLHIANNSTIGAGAVVTKDTEENSVSMGLPAKIVKYKNPE